MLGRGGMATVYLARDLKHDRDVAVKVLRPELAATLGSDRFLREIQIAAKLSHPHIVPLFDSAEDDGRLLYVMPYLAGESLRERLDRDRRLPVAEATEIARQVASALAYAHGQGVVHRDIKPENILLQAGQAVVADFGIARAIDAAGAGDSAGRLTETGITIGTPRYMSPEQILGGEVDGASDIYSLGCVLYEMLAGEPPFDGPTARAVLARHSIERAPSLRERRAEVSRALADSVATALAKAPGDRFPTAARMAEALGSATVPPSPIRRERRAGRIAARLAGAAAVALVGWWALGPQNGRDGGPPPSPTASVAVLYLDNLSRDSNDVYLVDGITEEIISRLGQVERLAIPSRGAVRRWRGRAVDDPAAVGRTLGVTHLLGGSVQRAGARLRVRIELVNASTGARIWGRTLDQLDGDVLVVADTIAQAVAREVVGRLAPEELTQLTLRPTQSREAYDHYLKGNFHLARRASEADGRRALEEYQAALRIDPRFAAALGRLGLVYGIYASWPWVAPGRGMDSMVALGLAAANRALELDSTSADGWLARGFLLTPALIDADGWRGFAVAPFLMVSGLTCRVPVLDCRAEAVRALARAVDLDPRNGEVWYQYGRAQMGSAAGDSAIVHALSLTPDLTPAAWHLGLNSLRARNPERAALYLDSAIALGRRDLSVYGLRTEARIARGDGAGARADLETVARLVTDSVSAVYHGYLEIAGAARMGDSGTARALADSLLRRFPPTATRRHSIWFGLAAALVTVGSTDRGVALLEQAIARGDDLRVTRNPVWDPIRKHPRFRRLEELGEAGRTTPRD
ncbi:MAG: protein kinase domain-containing protein [Gemmatimonadales bacterium]